MTSRDISLIAKRKVRNASFDLKRLLKISWRRVVRFLISLLQVYLCFLLIETGNVTLFKGVLPVSFISGAFLLNFSIIFLFIAIIYLIVGSDYLCGIVSITVSSLIAIVNHYVVLLHGMPLSFQELQNFGTALNVIRGMTITPDATFFKIMGLFFFGLFLSMGLYVLNVGNSSKWGDTLWKRLIYAIVAFGVFDMVILSPASKKPESILAWSWREVYPTYGFALCSLESFQNLHNVVERPDGYEVADIPTLNISTWYTDERPDIIMILNETFYDFNVVTQLETDTEFLPYISNMEDLKKGYVVVPNFGGGTNATEYELLTGNSNRLINNFAPFNVIDMNDSLSIVSVLNELGYETTAMHSESGSNYSRYRGYIVKMVETDEHEQYLKNFGCRYAQGYHYYKPMDVSSLEKIIKVRENVDYSGIKGWLEETNEEPEEPETSVIENTKGKNFFRGIVDIRRQVRRKVGDE